MLVFVKLGGSLLTDKKVEASFRETVATRIAGELKTALDSRPDLQLLVGHGSGSFGHFAAARYGTIHGVHTSEQWRGFAEVATIAAELNYRMARTFQSAGVPVWRIQPSASALASNGVLESMAVEPIREALSQGIVPLIYGDVALDRVRGGTILSTEALFFYLAQHLPVTDILLLGEVEGVHDAQGIVIPEITTNNYREVELHLKGSAGVDVTGGMHAKVREMLNLVSQHPTLVIRIFDGTRAGLLQQTLLGQAVPGTLIKAY
jgi:isopentenyl phosphate kinase